MEPASIRGSKYYLSCGKHISMFGSFFLSSLKIAMDSLKKSTVIVIVVVWASFSFLDFASGCGGCGPCKYTLWDGIFILNLQVNNWRTSELVIGSIASENSEMFFFQVLYDTNRQHLKRISLEFSALSEISLSIMCFHTDKNWSGWKMPYWFCRNEWPFSLLVRPKT